MWYRVSVWMIACLLVPSAVCVAEDVPAATGNVFEQIKIELLDLRALGEDVDKHLVGEAYRLSLEECVILALVNNKDVEIVEFEDSIAWADLVNAKGIFDPTFSAFIGHVDSSNPPSPTEEAFGGFSDNIDAESTDYQLKVGGLFNRWGTRYSVDYSVNREAGTFTTNPITMDELSVYTGAVSYTHLTLPTIYSV